MNKLVAVIFILAFCSCKSSKEAVSNANVYETKVGENWYYFQQEKNDTSCAFHSLPNEKLIQFLELNHDGDKDDKPPRKLLALDTDNLSIRKKEKFTLPIRSKVCLDPNGNVRAIKGVSANEHQIKAIKEAWSSIKYESNSEANCIECKEQRFWIAK